MSHPAHHGPTATRERARTGPAKPGSVGIVIATRNRRASLAVTVRNLLALPERPEVLVVDNASTDDTRAMLARDFPQVRILALPVNRGALARTHGVRALDTPYVAFSDDDSWWAPGSLRAAARHFDEHPRLGLLSARTLVGPHRRRGPPQRPARPLPRWARPPTCPAPRCSASLGCAAVARRTAYLDAGGYHPLLFFGAEETLLAYDLAARGWGVTHCPDVIAHHHPDPRPRTGRPAVVRRNELLTAWLRRPFPHALARTRRLAADARRDPHARHALRETLARLPAALRARRPLPPHVERAARLLDEGDGAAP
ncbi:glycosyltransferase [Streptomyces sp. RS2]|uniref:glycosyltransferase family 2 protein n=1 Tax=Streptomyces sp. RS2 TaxID=1451205 RepID=UPI0021F817A3|nr:glycosyltransferase [Streptomyces sp. RS2]MCW1097318.1 glycosyltransferase [Streptomyces sp. RS2]